MTLEYWYLFPISVLIATIATATGIGGAVFFSPLFMPALRLEPSVTVGTALITELFGFSSGLVGRSHLDLIPLQHHRPRHGPRSADADETQPSVPSSHFVGQRGHDAATGRRPRMPHRDRAP